MIDVRRYGSAGPSVVLVHGGPGAPGSLAPVARRLAGMFRVFEPHQRRHGGAPLTVERHVRDLHEVIEAVCPQPRPALVGHSWGAMLALAYAAADPEGTGPVVLIGCGTFDPAARERFRATLDERTDDTLRRQLAELPMEPTDPDERLRAYGQALLPIYSCDLASTDLELSTCDAEAYRETWNDMLRLQEEGVYPAAFSAVAAPVLMLYGDVDPHPGDLIRASLEPVLPQLEVRVLERCGHYPWLERHAREPFLQILQGWLTARLAS